MCGVMTASLNVQWKSLFFRGGGKVDAYARLVGDGECHLENGKKTGNERASGIRAELIA